MRKWIAEQVENVLNSLNTDKPGFSARKLSAFAAVMVSMYITIKHSTDTNVDTLIMTWLTFSLLCMGLITFAQLAQFKNGGTIKETTSLTSETTITAK